ncbi:unnamed protein product [Urochloa decumbens]|uniref:Uncharacterized protein n=1 Tax=Urochloa decumbens TaxID=240449 RepID=A0ABC8VYM9_9POAL
MWSTVVLLGGFVTVLHKKDFWCVTVISMTQAARIFNDLAEQLGPNFVSMLARNIIAVLSDLRKHVRRFARDLERRPAAVSTWCRVLPVLFDGIISLPLNGIGYVAACLYWYSGPFVCIALSLWRIAQRDYTGGDASSGNAGNLVPALDMFYSLVLLQGGLYVFWATWDLSGDYAAQSLSEYCRRIGLPDEGWCRDYIARYLVDTRARCWREPASIRGRTMRHFALESLDSGSWEEMHSGVRWLDALARQGEDLRPHLLPCRPRIQKLIEALGWRQPEGAIEMRVAAARIVARLARDIHLAQFPGALECISSLLHKAATDLQLTNKQTGGPNELILRGLAILEGITFNDQNCTTICSAPGLVRKIMAPLSSAHLMQDIRNNVDWPRVVSGSLEVLYILIKAPGEASWRLRREICSNEQSMSNLEGILKRCDEAGGFAGRSAVTLQMGAMGILTQLALDPSVNLAKHTKQNLVKKQLHVFLADGEQPAAELKPVKALAGRTLLLLSTDIESSNALIMTAHNDIVGRLTGKLVDTKNTSTYRTIAAKILENLCAHCDLDKQWVKETLLPKVLTEILSSKRVAPGNRVSPPSDEEKQQNSAQQYVIEIQETSSPADQDKSSDAGNEEQTTTSKLMREAFLSLALVIRDKLISADDFDDAVQKEGLGPAAFVAKMKTIVEENCQETAESLRIVKLCGRIVEPMMQHDLYAQHFRNIEFVKSLSKASTIMSNLESCMLFAETDFGPRKTVRPTLSVLKNRALHLVG